MTDTALTQIPKYRSPDELKPIVEAEKEKGKTVVFGNGAFDILHVGHVRYLKAAKALGDVLIVAINSDISVQKLKGPTRPILPEFDRISLVASVDVVDYVTTFDDEKVSGLLTLLKPNVHAKGTDYRKPEEVPEANVVADYGGETAIVGDPKDHSTTDIIGTILAQD